MGKSRKVENGSGLTSKEAAFLANYRRMSPENQKVMDELTAAYSDMAHMRKNVSRMNFLILSAEVVSRLERLEQRMTALENSK